MRVRTGAGAGGRGETPPRRKPRPGAARIPGASCSQQAGPPGDGVSSLLSVGRKQPRLTRQLGRALGSKSILSARGGAGGSGPRRPSTPSARSRPATRRAGRVARERATETRAKRRDGGNALTPFPFPDTRETLPRARAVWAGPRRPHSRGGVRLATPLPESRAQRHVRDGRAGPRTLRAREARVQPLPRPRSGRGRAVSRAAGRTPPGGRLPTPQGALRRAPRHPHRPVQTRLAAGVPGPQHRV